MTVSRRKFLAPPAPPSPRRHRPAGVRPGAGDAEAASLPAAGLQRPRQDAGAVGQDGRAGLRAASIKIDIFPSMQLGGTPPQLYDQARDGVVDIVWTLPGSTAGRFPSTEVFELPFVGARRGIVNARASQEYADANLAKETGDIKLLSYWSHDHGLIHANKAVKTMEDLKGLKLRSPTRLAGEALKALGATAVPDADPAGAREPGAARHRRLRGAVGGGAGHQAARAGQVPHRDPGLADALHGELLPRHEQGQVRGPAGRPQGGRSTRTPA